MELIKKLKSELTRINNKIVLGDCGSCWAFASAACIETHLAISTNSSSVMELSMANLLHCTPNPMVCGGKLAVIVYYYLFDRGSQK